MPSPRWRTPLQSLSYHSLLVPPLLLALATIISLFFLTDVNAPLLWSQCHARARIPLLSRIPALGTPLCYLVSFFQEALASLRTRAAMAVVLSLVGALLTVTTVEAARACNAASVLIAYPTGGWLVFILLGGAVVWEVVVIPAFLHRGKEVLLWRDGRSDGEVEEGNVEDGRHLAAEEAVAIPLGVALGFYVPSAVMLAHPSPAAVGVWLFFPVYVSLVRQAVRWAAKHIRRDHPARIHLESTWWPLIGVYAVPILCSVATQGVFIWSLTLRDDRKEITRSTFRFIEIDILFTYLTALYWVLVEVGWRVPGVMLVTSVIVGPGTGICLGWLYREKEIQHGYMGPAVQEERDEDLPDEERPLLR